MSQPTATIVKTTVTGGPFYNAAGKVATGLVIFKPLTLSLGGDIVISDVPVRRTLRNGSFSIDLPTGVTDGSTAGIVYEYARLLDGGDYSRKQVQVPVSEEAIDIGTLVPVTPSPEEGRFVLPHRETRPLMPTPGEAYYNKSSGLAEYWDAIAESWVPLSDALVAAPNGPAGGSLAGTYPNPTLKANSVGTTELKDNSVTAAKLTVDYVTRNTYLVDLTQTGVALSDIQAQVDEKLDASDTVRVIVLEIGEQVPDGTPGPALIVRKQS